MKYRIRFYFPSGTYFQIIPDGKGREGLETGFSCYVSVLNEHGKEQNCEKTTDPMSIEKVREHLMKTGNQPLGHDMRYCLGVCDQDFNRIAFDHPIDFLEC